MQLSLGTAQDVAAISALILIFRFLTKYQLRLLFVCIILFCIWKKLFPVILLTNSPLLNNGKLHLRVFVENNTEICIFWK